mmetsp:Transcript_36338/g.26452  ORF Transcript_36338/g.26452 Transcript_36338/m.26452 type:complete len:127 (-) Transcript_36338:1397-1777(-)
MFAKRYLQKPILKRPAFMAQQSTRNFAQITPEAIEQLKSLGITQQNIVFNPSVAECYEYALKPEHLWSPDPTVGTTTITETGALSISSGSKTGRVPKDKRIVLDEETKDTVNWGDVNIPMSREVYN